MRSSPGRDESESIPPASLSFGIAPCRPPQFARRLRALASKDGVLHRSRAV